MKAKYFSHAQACAIYKDCQYLKGGLLDEHHHVDTIVVAPHSAILQWQFLQDLVKNGVYAATAAMKNPTGRYDVLVIGYTERGPGYVREDIRSYLSRLGTPLNSARYECLRNANIPPTTLQRILQ